MLPTVTTLLPALAVSLSWAGVGRLAVRRAWLAGEGVLLRIAVRAGIGAAVSAVVLYVLGRAALFDRWLVVAATLAAVPLGVIEVADVWRARAWPARPGRGTLALGAVCGVALLLDVVAAAAPPTSADALAYHLELPKAWLAAGSIGDAFWFWPTFNPFATELLFAQGLALGGGAAGSAIGGLVTVLAAACVFGLARELAGGRARAGLFGLALFVLQGILTWSATGSFVEPATTAYAVLAAWLVLRCAHTGRDVLGVLAGGAAGAAAGTKYLGLVPAALTAVAVLIVSHRRRHAVSFALLAAAALGGVWYVKNAVVAGNPVYPLLFGGRDWSSVAASTVPALHDAYGVGASPLRLVLLPVDLLLHGGAFDRGQYVGTAIFVCALLAPLARERRAAIVAVLAGAAYVVAWWISSPQARFLLPALGIFAAAGGAGLHGLLRRHPRLAPVAGVGFVAVAVAWAVASVGLTRQSTRVVLGLESQAVYAQRLTGTYDALHRAHGMVEGTLALAGYLQLYYYPGRALFLGDGEFSRDVPRTVYLDRLHREGVTFVLAQSPDQVGSLAPIRPCLRRVAELPARFVTSRARGTSVPLTLVLFRVRCGSAT